MRQIYVHVNDTMVGSLVKDGYDYHFTYHPQILSIDFVSLAMPVRPKSYEYRDLFPVFEMNLPEGYLLELFRDLLQKRYGEVDDFLLLAFLGENSRGRLRYRNDFLSVAEKKTASLDIDEVTGSVDKDLFKRLLELFLDQSALSGVQPKVLATLKDKATLHMDDYIVKTWGEEYSRLSENEYFCMRAAKIAGIDTAVSILSDNKRLFLSKRFDKDPVTGESYAFEEVGVLQAKGRSKKYSGSYEQVAKTVALFVSDEYRDGSLLALYKIILISYLLRNGDAHLKNFGLLYTQDGEKRWLSPAYDIVTTTAYLYQDTPALMMFGKKVWFGRKELETFGVMHCYLTRSQASKAYDECLSAMLHVKDEIVQYVKDNPEFQVIGGRMVASWKSAIDGETHKDISHALR